MTNFLKSFTYAFNGIILALNQERNFRIQWLCGLVVLLFNLLLELGPLYQIIMLILIAAVLSLELLNSAIEHTCNTTGNSLNKDKKLAKDSAAGSVLIFSLFSLLCFYIIFEAHFSLIENAWLSKKYGFLSIVGIFLTHAFLCFSTPRLWIVGLLVAMSLLLHGVVLMYMTFSLTFLTLSIVAHLCLALAQRMRLVKESLHYE